MSTVAALQRGAVASLESARQFEGLKIIGTSDFVGDVNIGDASTDIATFASRCVLRLLASDPKHVTPGSRPAGTTGEIARYGGKLYHCTSGTTPTWEMITSS